MNKILLEIAKIKSLIKRGGSPMSEFDAQTHIHEEYESLKKNENQQEIFYFDLTTIPIDEIKKQYVDYRLTAFVLSFDNPLRYINEDKSDGTSRPLGEVQNSMFDKYHFMDWQFQILNGRNGIEVCVIVPLIGENAEMVEKDMDAFGYFCSKRVEQSVGDMVFLQMKYEPSFQEDISNIVQQYEYIYHVTPSENLQSIYHDGLTPKNSNTLFTYPPRVFLIKGDVTEKGQDLIAQMLFKASNRQKSEMEYTILKLQVDLIPDIPFYYDPNHEHGIFTNETIPSAAIVGARNITVRKKI